MDNHSLQARLVQDAVHVFKSKDLTRFASKATNYSKPIANPKPRWEELWSRKGFAPKRFMGGGGGNSGNG
jgi:hypothetical protein